MKKKYLGDDNHNTNEDEKCWCKPVEFEVDKDTVAWLHRDADGKTVLDDKDFDINKLKHEH